MHAKLKIVSNKEKSRGKYVMYKIIGFLNGNLDTKTIVELSILFGSLLVAKALESLLGWI